MAARGDAAAENTMSLWGSIEALGIGGARDDALELGRRRVAAGTREVEEGNEGAPRSN